MSFKQAEQLEINRNARKGESRVEREAEISDCKWTDRWMDGWTD